jgi:hypothetical protein
VLKATVAQFDGTFWLLPYSRTILKSALASELITNREIVSPLTCSPDLRTDTDQRTLQVSARIRDDLLNRAKEFNIQLEDVSIVGRLPTLVLVNHADIAVLPPPPLTDSHDVRTHLL